MKLFRLAVAAFLLTLGLAGTSSAQVEKAMPYYNAGNMYYSQKNYDLAVRYYQAATQFNPNLWQAYQGMGNCYYAKGDKATALTNYQKALNLNPNNSQLSSFVQVLQAQVNSAPPLPAASASGPSMASFGSKTIEINALVGGAVGASASYGATLSYPATTIGMGTGIGGGLEGYYLVGNNLGVGLIVDYFTGYGLPSSSVTAPYFNQSYQVGTATVKTSNNTTSLEIMPAIKYKFDGDNIRPYLMGSVGYASLSATSTVNVTYDNGTPLIPYPSGNSSPQSNSGPMVQLGLGAEFLLGADAGLFLQVKYSMIFVGSQTVDNVAEPGFTFSSIPIEAGVSFGI